MPEQPLVDTSDLRIVRSAATEVVLAGLPPVYAHGLSVLLQAAGLPTTVVPDIGQLAVDLARPEPRVTVVPSEHAAALLPPFPRTPRHAVVALVGAATPDVCAELLRAGVTGILTGDDPHDDVLLLLRCAARDRTALPRELVRMLCRPAKAASPALTATERAWLQRLAAGGTVAGLARSCGYSEREMYRRLSTVYLRLGARTRTEALLLAERSGLLGGQPDP